MYIVRHSKWMNLEFKNKTQRTCTFFPQLPSDVLIIILKTSMPGTPVLVDELSSEPWKCDSCSVGSIRLFVDVCCEATAWLLYAGAAGARLVNTCAAEQDKTKSSGGFRLAQTKINHKIMFLQQSFFSISISKAAAGAVPRTLVEITFEHSCGFKGYPLAARFVSSIIRRKRCSSFSWRRRNIQSCSMVNIRYAPMK